MTLVSVSESESKFSLFLVSVSVSESTRRRTRLSIRIGIEKVGIAGSCPTGTKHQLFRVDSGDPFVHCSKPDSVRVKVLQCRYSSYDESLSSRFIPSSGNIVA